MSAGNSASRRSRRQFVRSSGVVGLGLLVGCALPVSAPSPVARVHRVALLTGDPSNAESAMLIATFREGLRDLGYVEGQNLLIEQRHATAGDALVQAAELVRLQ